VDYYAVNIKFNFQHTMGTKIALPEVSLCTQDSSSVRLRTQGMTYHQRYQSVLGCDAMYSGRYVPTFRKNVLHPSSGYKFSHAGKNLT
jgi:hypothetical protein